MRSDDDSKDDLNIVTPRVMYDDNSLQFRIIIIYSLSYTRSTTKKRKKNVRFDLYNIQID